MSDNNRYFQREIEFTKGSLVINQAYIGDVGHVVWDAAIALAKFIDGDWFVHAFPLVGKNVVEIGAGTGLVGMVAAMHGATVQITDLDDLQELMNKNIEENDSLFNGHISAETLKWGTSIEEKWKADIILLADCIYYEESLHPLLDTIKRLCQQHTQIFMSYEERDTEHKIALQKKFFKLVAESFHIDRISQDKQDPMFSSNDIHIYHMIPN